MNISEILSLYDKQIPYRMEYILSLLEYEDDNGKLVDNPLTVEQITDTINEYYTSKGIVSRCKCHQIKDCVYGLYRRGLVDVSNIEDIYNYTDNTKDVIVNKIKIE